MFEHNLSWRVPLVITGLQNHFIIKTDLIDVKLVIVPNILRNYSLWHAVVFAKMYYKFEMYPVHDSYKLWCTLPLYTYEQMYFDFLK